MLVIRGTKTLRDRVKGPLAAEGEQSTGALGDWFANALFWRPHVALLVNSRTMLPVSMELAPAATLLDRAPAAIEAVLRRYGVDEASLGCGAQGHGRASLEPQRDRDRLGGTGNPSATTSSIP